MKSKAFDRIKSLKSFVFEKSDKAFNGLNGQRIELIGIVRTNIKLKQTENFEFNIELFFAKNVMFAGDIILGREFLDKGNLTYVYTGQGRSDVDQANNMLSVLSVGAVEEPVTSLKKITEEIEIQFHSEYKDKLAKIILETDECTVAAIDDNYSVHVRLRDKSTYAYAPRRFAYAERMELRRITDELLDRGIIRPSVSPYCARVLLVKRKNGQSRMCVDLRPLNSRVEKQKFPFPVIEDCLSRLANKKVFSLLDLKDSFHLIKVDEESRKYFAFATPDGQYEYTCLPFGYSDSPAEFQERLMQILNPLVRKDKVIIYMDDLLIATETVEENLKGLKEVLSILKKYKFELNYKKCQFLKKQVEFLGYILSAKGITLSQRHTSAVLNFKEPRSVAEAQRFLGLVEYFRKFIKNFAMKAGPLQDLLKKNKEFEFNKKCKESFSNY